MKKPSAKLDLHARLKRHGYDHAIITTFTFRASFFEEYALEAFNSLQNNGNITVILDERQYQEMLQLAKERPTEFPKQANLRYLLHPVRVPGVFHPKISLFTSKRRGLLLIGSANFTQDGLGSNAEMVSAFDFEEEKNEDALPLFLSALGYLEKLAARWPSEGLSSNLAELRRDTPWLTRSEAPAPVPRLPELLHNLDEPLWEQLMKRLPESPQSVSVLSRFFDSHPALAGHLFATTKADKLTIYTQNEVTTLTPAWLETPEFKERKTEIKLCQYSDEDYPQQLHGKAYAFACGDKQIVAIGSANFTSAALRQTASNGNVEVLLCYPPLPAKEFKPEKWFDPSGSARALKRADELIVAKDNPDEPKPDEPALSSGLFEAYIEGRHLELRVDSAFAGSTPQCVLLQEGCRPEYLATVAPKAGFLRCELPDRLAKDLRTKPSMVQLGLLQDGKWTPQTNLLLVANLQDLATNQDQRRQRQIKEARESPQRFMEVLTLICSSEDEERLKAFLTYCDIPIDLPVKLLRSRGNSETDQEKTGEALRTLGQKNLRHFELLHEAVIDFVDRHERRLKRHIDRGTVHGIPNFLHILLTIENLLLLQIERVIFALEAESQMRVDADRWFNTRAILDAYFVRLKSLLKITATDYVNAIDGSAPAEEVREAFSDGFPLVLELTDRSISSRDKIVALVGARLRINTGSGATDAQFFNECIGAKKWPQALREFETQRAVLAKYAA